MLDGRIFPKHLSSMSQNHAYREPSMPAESTNLGSETERIEFKKSTGEIKEE